VKVTDENTVTLAQTPPKCCYSTCLTESFLSFFIWSLSCKTYQK
jgi:hypothetical protein